MRTLRLEDLQGRSGFALLGPGFHDDRAWALVTELRPAETGAVGLWLADYETPGAQARRFTGAVEWVEVALDAPPPSPLVGLEEGDFLPGVQRIREAIAAGDVYQVNLTCRARLEGLDGGGLLSRLCRRGTPRFAAWVSLEDGTEWVSASPELLFAVQGSTLRAEPMKGTAPAGQRAWLEASEKDRAELAMITDLLRDDLNRLCEPRSVQVPCARRFIELPYAVQTVSDVMGTIRAGIGVRQILQQLHPGGSVTGAPREAARKIISELEVTPRGAYCGALALEQADQIRCALLIRTAARVGPQSWIYGVGGGITWDSDPAAELEEVRLKLGALF